MPNDTPIEEQEQVKRLLERYLKLEASKTLPLYLLVGILCPVHLFFQHHPIDWYILGAGCTISFYSFYAVYILRQKFIKQITPEELDLIARTPRNAFADDEKRALKGLTKAYHKIHPQKEYLRASTEPQDDTLLRPATQQPDNTPQEQLLRSSDTTGS